MLSASHGGVDVSPDRLELLEQHLRRGAPRAPVALATRCARLVDRPVCGMPRRRMVDQTTERAAMTRPSVDRSLADAPRCDRHPDRGRARRLVRRRTWVIRTSAARRERTLRPRCDSACIVPARA
jgi:hypothetical protein